MSAAPSRILLVDDNAELRALYRTALAESHRVDVAARGDEAWELVRDNPPDLLICDAEMPGMDGQALCRRVRESDEVPPLPVFLLTEAPGGDGEPAGDVADEVLEKPFSAAALRRRANQFLPPAELPEGLNTESPFVKRVVRIVERRLHDPGFTVAELAKAMGLSRRHLTRRLKAAAEVTPAEFIRSRRIERAKTKLEAGPETIREVSQTVGFRSSSHFSQAFREEVGCSPSTYRERHAS